jgi:GDSL-like Lipase/Acylhydrolase family
MRPADSKGHRRARSAGCLLAMMTSLLAACGSASASTKPDVVVVGDSITHQSTPQIDHTLGTEYHLDVQAVPGMRIVQMLPALRTAMKGHPFAVIENLGTNDAIQARKGYDWKKYWSELLATTRNTSCVVLTTISTAADYYGSGTVGAAINADIASLAAKDPQKYKEVDWNGFLHSRGSGWRTYLSADLIHPLPAGRQAIATMDKQALAQCRK